MDDRVKALKNELPSGWKAQRLCLACLALLTLAGCVRQGASPIQQSKANAETYVIQGQQAIDDGQLSEAIALFEQAIAENPELANAYVGIADIYQVQGDHFAAEAAYGKAARLEPHHFKTQFNHGLMLQLLDRLTDAVRAYLRALSIDPDHHEANLNLATAYLQLDEPRQALPYARRAVQLVSSHGPSRVNLGAVYAAMGRHNDAVDEYQAAAELMDLTPTLLINLADSLGKAKRYQEMVNTLQQLIRLEPSALAYERLGSAFFHLRRRGDAQEAFEQAVTLDARHYPAYNGVGVCLLNKYLLSGRQDLESRRGALGALRKSVQIKRDQPKIIDLISRYG